MYIEREEDYIYNVYMHIFNKGNAARFKAFFELWLYNGLNPVKIIDNQIKEIEIKGNSNSNINTTFDIRDYVLKYPEGNFMLKTFVVKELEYKDNIIIDDDIEEWKYSDGHLIILVPTT